jgi:membrane protease YdiL (CAAX protease family)
LFARRGSGTILFMNRRTISVTGDPPAAASARSAWAFFLLTIVLSLPFWLLGALSGFQLLPALPLSALGVVCPAAAGVILSARESGAGAVRSLLKRSFDLSRMKSKAWLLPAILLMPLVSLGAYGVQRLMGMAMPPAQLSVVRTLDLLLAFFLGGLSEELGWSGYATDPLQQRFGALTAALIIGAVWAAWHFIPLAEAHRSFEFIAWWTVGTIAMRVIIVWLYNSTGGSVVAAALLHAMSNLAWQLFPVNGSSYDPRINGLILTVVATALLVVRGPRTLARRAR